MVVAGGGEADVVIVSSLSSTSTTSSSLSLLSRSPHRLLSRDNIAAAVIIPSAGLCRFRCHRPHPPSSLRTPRTRPFACCHLPTPRRSRCCRPPHLDHLLLAVIVVTIAPPPAFARQHCHRRHNCLCGSLPISSSLPPSAVLPENSSNPRFRLPHKRCQTTGDGRGRSIGGRRGWRRGNGIHFGGWGESEECRRR